MMPFVCEFLHIFNNLDLKGSNQVIQQTKPRKTLQACEKIISASSTKETEIEHKTENGRAENMTLLPLCVKGAKYPSCHSA